MGREAGGRRGVFGPRLLRPGPREASELEVEHHLAELTERLEAAGMAPTEARAEAERRFGDPEAYRARLERTERRRTMMGWALALDLLSSGLKRSARTLRRNPGFAAGVVVTLALGIGANAVMFGILDRLLFQPPSHVVDHEEVVRLMVERPYPGEVFRFPLGSFPDYLDMKAHRGFEAVAAWSGPAERTLGHGASATRVRVTQASHELFPLLGVRPRLGRFYGADEDRIGAPPHAVVSEEYWSRAMGRDPGAIGRVLSIAGTSYTVIGVAPEGFTGADLAPVDVWLPLETSQALTQGTEWRAYRDFFWIQAVARMHEGTDVTAAAAEATRLHHIGRAESIEKGRYPVEAHIELDPLILARGPEALAESKVARWLGGVSLVVLLIACANVTNLLLARGVRRRREIAVRLALGVERTRLTAEMLLETLLLTLLGSVGALALATWGGAVIRAALLPGIQFPASGATPRTIGFTLVAALLSSLILALGPALQALRTHVAGTLSRGAGAGSPRRSRSRGLLTVTQAALSVLLLVGAGLFVRSMAEVRRVDLGLDTDRLLLARLELGAGPEARGVPAGTQTTDAEAQIRSEIYRATMSRLAALPGVESVAGTDTPFQMIRGTEFRVPGTDSLPNLPGGGPYYQNVTPGYFRTVGLSILHGRGLEAGDDAGSAKVVVVSETMARTLWPGADPLGRTVLIGDEEEPFTVVGVVEDASRGFIRDEPFMAYYMSLLQRPLRPVNALYLRANGDVASVAAAAAQAARTIDVHIRFATVEPLRDLIDPQAREWRLGATLFTLFGLLALVVAAIGLYSVLAFDVAERTKELGIRAALGAERRRLLARVIVEGLSMAGSGVALGLAAAVAAAPYARDLLFEVSPRDPAVLASVAVSMLAVAGIASLAPALRATRVDPMVALRSD